jgi:hypothetical protein
MLSIIELPLCLLPYHQPSPIAQNVLVSFEMVLRVLQNVSKFVIIRSCGNLFMILLLQGLK